MRSPADNAERQCIQVNIRATWHNAPRSILRDDQGHIYADRGIINRVLMVTFTVMVSANVPSET